MFVLKVPGVSVSHRREWEGNAGSFNLGLCASTRGVPAPGGCVSWGWEKGKDPVIILWKNPVLAERGKFLCVYQVLRCVDLESSVDIFTSTIRTCWVL